MVQAPTVTKPRRRRTGFTGWPGLWSWALPDGVEAEGANGKGRGSCAV